MLNLKKIVFILTITIVVLIAAIGVYYRVKPSIKKPVIGVIEVEGYLLFSGDRKMYLRAIDTALKNDTIKAVVVRINSGGGLATVCEEIYGDLRKLSRVKPVVASIEGLAASGGYYIALGANYIYATPSSMIGNVGVIAYAPSIVLPTEEILETGAYKLAGFSVREFPLVLETIFQTFVDSVRESRGNRLRISIDEVSTGKLFIAAQAVEAGLIDDLGSYLDAIDKAASLANITEYEVVDLTKKAKIELQITAESTGYWIWISHGKIPESIIANLSEMGYLIYYVPPYMVENPLGFYDVISRRERFYDEMFRQTVENTNATRKIVIDLSHRNVFLTPIMMEFIGKLVEKGGKILFLKSNNFEEALKAKPSALIIFTPFESYRGEEIKAIKQYIKNGGKLVIAHDPAIDFPIYVNELAQEFGFVFGTGYLYSSESKYGIYRNVIVETFENSSLTKDIDTLIIFTGTSIYTNATKIALTSSDTKMAITDRASEHTIIALNGTVLALSDITFMLDPFIQLADNEKFVDNLVDWLLRDLEEREG